MGKISSHDEAPSGDSTTLDIKLGTVRRISIKKGLLARAAQIMHGYYCLPYY